MTFLESGDQGAPKDRVPEDALGSGLREHGLSEEALARVRAATETAWRERYPAEPLTSQGLRRRRAAFLAAAAIATFALGVGWWTVDTRATGDSSSIGMLARAESPGVQVLRALGRTELLPEGATLRVGQRLRIDAGAAFELHDGVTLRAARGTVLSIASEQAVALERGEIYLDAPPAGSVASALIVRAGGGQFEHVGTQFAVATGADATRLRVREGAVRWQRESASEIAESGTELFISGGGHTTRRPIATSGPEWEWAEQLAPTFDIENRTLGEFLTWAARETGRRLVVLDERARKGLAQTRLHGSIRGLAPLDAVRQVVKTTSVRVDFPPGEIRVASLGESKRP